MDPRRLVLVRTGGPGGSGSGYLVGPQLVLTALHVVAPGGRPARRVLARIGHPRSGSDPVEREARVCWPDLGASGPPPGAPDVALLRLAEAVQVDGDPVRWGRPGGAVPLPFEGAGFPAFAAEDGGAVAQFEHLRGELSPVSTTSTGWVLDCTRVWPAERRDAQRPWAGASGAAVFCHGLLVGVAVEDDPGMGWRRLHAVPVQDALDRPGFRDLVLRCGHTGTTASVQEVAAAPDRTTTGPPYPAAPPASVVAASVVAAGSAALSVVPDPSHHLRRRMRAPDVRTARVLFSGLVSCAVITALFSVRRSPGGGFDVAGALVVLVLALLAWLVRGVWITRGTERDADMSGTYAPWLPALGQAELQRIRSDLRLRGIEHFATDVPWEPAFDLAADGAPEAYGREAGRSVRRLVALWRAARPARLLISGPAGSGKSVALALLARQLLEENDGSLPVPVVVSLAGWDAGTPFYTWIARRLAERYPAIVGEDGGVPADELEQALQDDRLLLFLDGFDEVGAPARDTFLARLSEILSTDGSCVLASRDQALLAARRGDRLMRGAVAVRLQPVTVRHFREFLAAFASQDRWEPVLRAMERGTAPMLTRAFETPLMHWLGLKVFEFGRRDPADLTDPERFPNAAAVQRHLLASIVPAVFEPAAGRSADHRYPARNAVRWLTFLARHSAPADGGIRWWRLHAHWKNQLGVLLAYGVLFVGAVSAAGVLSRLVATALAAGGLWGAFCGAAFTLTYGMARRPGRDRSPTAKSNFRDDADLGGVLSRLGRVLPALLAATAAVQLTVGLYPPGHEARQAWWLLGFGASVAAVCGSFGGTAAAFILVKRAHTDAGQSPRHAQNPHDLLRRDRKATEFVGACMFLATFVAAAFAWVATNPRGSAIGADAVAFVVAAAAVGAAVGPLMFTAWLTFRATHLFFCLLGCLPVRYSAFLTAAHSGGILRSEGVAYQFRHGLLRSGLLRT